MASKQDSNGVRTAQDLEKKYDFASLLGLKKNVEYAQKSILQINNELNNILNSLILNLKDVLDSQSEVSLWFYSRIPTTENEPYICWNAQEEHYGDIYYAELYCSKCGKCSEQLLLWGHEGEYDYTCPYCGNEMEW